LRAITKILPGRTSSASIVEHASGKNRRYSAVSILNELRNIGKLMTRGILEFGVCTAREVTGNTEQNA